MRASFFDKSTRLRQYHSVANPKDLDLIFGCCLGFTPEGYHIGYGSGDFDRFVESRMEILGKIVLLAYSFQEVRVKVGVHDVPLAHIVTEKWRRPG
jgi:5-formyltetrahydrofolate cyclo-ligase